MKGKVDIKKLKNRLSLKDYEKVIHALDIPFFTKGDKEWRLYDGTKGVDSMQFSPKLYFYPDRRIFCSYTTAATMDIFGLVQKRLAVLKEPCSFMDSVRFVVDVCKVEEENFTRLKKANVTDWEDDLGKFIRIKRNGCAEKIYDDSILDQLEPLYPECWLDEGIGYKTMEKYHIGYYRACDQTTIPVWNQNGDLVGIRCRNWNEDRLKSAKYIPLMTLNNDYTFNTGNYLYGLNYNWYNIQESKTVFIGESEKFVLWLDTHTDNCCAVGMFGSSLGIKRRNQLLKLGVERVVLVPDCDYIGKDESAFKEWQDKLDKQIRLWDNLAKVEVVWDNLGLLGPKENATDRTKEVWDKLYENREVIE